MENGLSDRQPEAGFKLVSMELPSKDQVGSGGFHRRRYGLFQLCFIKVYGTRPPTDNGVYFLSFYTSGGVAILDLVPFSLSCRQATRWTEDKGEGIQGLILGISMR